MAIKVSGTEVISDDKRILNNESLPDIRPSLLLDFANSKTLDPRITFTRGSTATYWDGKTTAKAEENLVIRSQELDYWGKINVSVSADSTAAPDGTTTADTIIENAELGDHYINIGNAVSGVTYTVSCYAKNASGTRYFALRGFGKAGTFGQYPIFDLVNGTIINSGTDWSNTTITDVGNGWYRCSSTVVSSSTTNILLTLTTASAHSYTGDGTSGIYLWGAQLEQRSSATAYTPTTTSPIVKYQPVLQTAASGEARFDHDPVTGESKGLLIEEARTNLVTYSEAFDGTGWAKTQSGTGVVPVVTANQGIAPDGNQTADRIEFDSGAAGNSQINSNTIPVTLNVPYTFSVWMRSLSGDVSITMFLNALIQNVTVTSEWQRFNFTATETNLTTTDARIAKRDVWGTTGTADILIWGAQVEEGSFPTSYIPTSGSTVTRAVDGAEISGDNFSSWYSSNGTLYAEASYIAGTNYLANNAVLTVLAVDASPSSDNLVIYNRQGGIGFYGEDNNSGVFNGLGDLTIAEGASEFGYNSAALAFSNYNDASGAVNGTLTGSDTDYFLSGFDVLFIAKFYGSANPSSVHIKKLAFYPKRLPNATLQAMTEE